MNNIGIVFIIIGFILLLIHFIMTLILDHKESKIIKRNFKKKIDNNINKIIQDLNNTAQTQIRLRDKEIKALADKDIAYYENLQERHEDTLKNIQSNYKKEDGCLKYQKFLEFYNTKEGIK